MLPVEILPEIVSCEQPVKRDVASLTSFSGGRHPSHLYIGCERAVDADRDNQTYSIRHELVHQIVFLDDLI